MEALDQSMRAAGFESVPKPARADGVLPGLYKKADFGNVNVWVNPVVGGKAVDPAAKGVFGFDYASTQAGQ